MKTALLLIDILNDYFENGAMELHGALAAAENARLLLETFRVYNFPIIHVQHIAARPDATFFLPSTFGAEIHEKVKPLADEKVIIKHYPNSFRETDLLDFLHNNAVRKLVVCGMMTHMCVDSTVRAAKDYGFDVVLVGDACATKDVAHGDNLVCAYDVQISFLAAMNYFYASVTSAQEVLNSFSEQNRK